MGGYVGRASPEWNILCDAEAAQIVLRAGLPLTLIPLDVTMETRMRQEHIDALRAVDSDEMRWLMTLVDAWMARHSICRCCTIRWHWRSALRPDWVETQPFALDVVTASSARAGHHLHRA